MDEPRSESTGVLRVGGVEIHLDQRLVQRDGEPVHLTRTEWRLLEHLAANAGRVMYTNEILSTVWGPEYEGDPQFLRVWISRLRRKLEPRPGEQTLIKTMQGLGYLLDAADA